MTSPPAIRLKAPSLITTFGSTSAGKTYTTYRILENMNLMYEQPVTRVLMVYSVEHDLISKMEANIPNFTAHKGMPSEQYIDTWIAENDTSGTHPHKLIVFDDMQSVLMDTPHIMQLACVKMHHTNTSVHFLVQNVYNKGRFSRTISLQSTYYLILKSLRDRTQLGVLSRQVFPEHPRLLIQAFKDVCQREKYPYLLLDLSCNGKDDTRVRTNIFPQDEYMVVYRPK